MNRDEQIVDAYLKSLDLGDVVYEPDGKVPPDFLIAGRIAVESRRLNQHYDVAGRSRGLEEDSIPLQQSFERLLADFGGPRDDTTWFVFFRIKRPIPTWKILRPLIRGELERFLQRPSSGTVRVAIDSGFEISLTRASTVGERVFLLGGDTDLDSGGWVVSEIIRNLSVYVAEKTQKVAPYRSKYPVWWLVFVDYIGYAHDEAEVRQYFKCPADWDRVLLLSPISGRAYEI
jgi:hypothetical protein